MARLGSRDFDALKRQMALIRNLRIMKWSKGGEAEYLNASKEGAIVLSDPADGPVTTTLNPDRSKTDLFNISLGIGF